ncbi:metal-dependent phosphohydrolase [Skermanella stibiiresistens SB22]|uniref:Metal-dependent phosphohydrolase n=1 Tax=Skermanella stibiiresistens SB22 TaxID=1385369 RepID=W9HB02_9PROT|nr:hypothetical protein [Skermanella stibiiresistens]EWY41926.1 metal-dependent phosphohydrolase [Skermanella stibiiresistens SB22]
MFDLTTLTAEAFGQEICDVYRNTFGGREPHRADFLASAARLAVERIANSDALYHDVHHTIMVTLVGQDILRGRIISQRVTPVDWVHFLLALMTHDIGYVRGVVPGDTADTCVIDPQGNSIRLPRGSTDAFLAPYHVERSKMFVRARFGGDAEIDVERVTRGIELTRFPVPNDGDHDAVETEPGLVRAADLIGQLADPMYLRKISGLYYEFLETGVAERLGYRSPADLVDHYPEFFWTRIEPFVGAGLRYLELTSSGKNWIANLYSHVFSVEHHRRSLGPHIPAAGPTVP